MIVNPAQTEELIRTDLVAIRGELSAIPLQLRQLDARDFILNTELSAIQQQKQQLEARQSMLSAALEKWSAVLADDPQPETPAAE